jgi:hypothetical protein
VIQIANRRDNAGGNDVAILSRIKKWRQKLGCAASFGNTEVKNRCRQLRCIAFENITLCNSVACPNFGRQSQKL